MSGKWDKLTTSTAKKSSDPIEEELRQEELTMAKQARRLRLEELIEQRKKRVQELKGTPGKGITKGAGYSMTAQDAAAISKLPEEDRQKAVETYAMFKGLEKSGGSGGSSMLPLLLMFSRNNPGASQSQMIDFMGRMVTALKPQQQVNMGDIAKVFEAGVNAAKTQNPTNQAETLKAMLTFVQPFYQQMSQKDQTIWNERLSRMEQQIVNPLDYLKETRTALDTLGLSTANNPQMALEIEKIRGDRELKLEEIRQNRLNAERQFSLEQQNRQWDREDNRERWSMVQGVLEGPVGQTIQNLGSGVQQRISGKQGRPVQPNIPNPVKIPCPNCNKQFVGSSDAKTVVCPHCGTQLNAVSQPENVAAVQQQDQPTGSQGVKRGMDGSKVS